MENKRKIKAFELIKKYPNWNKPLGHQEPYTSGDFLNYPDFWKPIYELDFNISNVSLYLGTRFNSRSSNLILEVNKHFYLISKESKPQCKQDYLKFSFIKKDSEYYLTINGLTSFMLLNYEEEIKLFLNLYNNHLSKYGVLEGCDIEIINSKKNK
jgi:hypothetical protein